MRHHKSRASHSLCLVPFAALLLGGGCAGPADDLADVTVVSADLSDWTEVEVAVLGGFVAADATLHFVDDKGAAHAVPVGVGGPVLGFVFDFHAIEEDSFWEGSAGASLGIPEGGVPAPALFEPYTGTGAGGGLALGGATHELENGAGVSLDAGGIGVGVGMQVSFEWFSIDPKASVE